MAMTLLGQIPYYSMMTMMIHYVYATSRVNTVSLSEQANGLIAKWGENFTTKKNTGSI